MINTVYPAVLLESYLYMFTQTGTHKSGLKFLESSQVVEEVGLLSTGTYVHSTLKFNLAYNQVLLTFLKSEEVMKTYHMNPQSFE